MFLVVLVQILTPQVQEIFAFCSGEVEQVYNKNNTKKLMSETAPAKRRKLTHSEKLLVAGVCKFVKQDVTSNIQPFPVVSSNFSHSIKSVACGEEFCAILTRMYKSEK
jgi:sulfite reductase beta subunit-like hemoprotein